MVWKIIVAIAVLAFSSLFAIEEMVDRDVGRRTQCKVMLLFLFTSIFFMMAWLHDISASALLSDGTLTNGIWNLDPMVGYHVSLWGMIGSFVSLIGITVDGIMNSS